MFRSIASIAVAGLLLVGCGSGISREAQENLGLVGAPDWYYKRGDGPYSAVGTAFIADGDEDLAVAEATAKARAEIANQLETSVQQILDADSSRKDKSATSQTTRQVKQIASQVMAGSRATAFWINNDGSKAFVLVKLPMASVEQIRRTLKSEKIDYSAVEQSMKNNQLQSAPTNQSQSAEKAKPSSTEEEW